MSDVEIQPPSGNTSENSGYNPGTANLKPWAKGQSGNPNGRPKMDPEVKRLLADKGKRAVERLCELIESEDERIALMAAKEIADRAYGKVKAVEDDDDADKRNVTINIVRMTPDDGNKPAAQVAPQAVSVRTLALS